MIGEYILLGVLLLSALFIVIAVTLQKSNEQGLSGTIAGGSDTYYGKDKAARKEKLIGKWTLIAAILFAVAVCVVYVIQPDYSQTTTDYSDWQSLTEFSSIFAD